MPTIVTIGAVTARGFGLTAGKKEPPGSITYNNGYSGAAYKPIGYSTVTITCYGAAGGLAGRGTPFGYPNAGYGSVATNNAVPNSNVMIRCPSGNRISQWSGGGNGGLGGASQYVPGREGGAVCAATWTGGVLVAAGGGGLAQSIGSPAKNVARLGGYEGTTALGDNYVTTSTSDGGNGRVAGAYYGGGGGGGGYSLGGGGGNTRNGGRGGGNGATPSTTGPGSYGYTSLSTDSTTSGYAVLSWG